MTTINGNGGIYAVATYDTAAFTLAAGGALTNSGTGGIGLFDAGGSGPLTIAGGAITESGLFGTGLDISGGSSPVTISGGAITASGVQGIGLLDDTGSSPLTISGGAFSGGLNGNGLYAAGSTVDITGGTFSAGTSGAGLISTSSGVIDLFGSGFSYTVNGMTTPITSGALPTGGTNGTLSGTLLDGQALNGTSFQNFATIEVNVGAAPVPEASTTVSFGLLLALGLGGLVIAAKRKKATG